MDLFHLMFDGIYPHGKGATPIEEARAHTLVHPKKFKGQGVIFSPFCIYLSVYFKTFELRRLIKSY